MARLNEYVIYDLLTNYWILWVSNIGFPEALGAPKFDGRPGVSHGVFRQFEASLFDTPWHILAMSGL